MRKCSLSKMVCIVFVFGAALAITLPAQTFTTLVSFNGTNGSAPDALIQATDGNFYGTTSGGGTSDNCGRGYGCGTVFRLTAQGTLTTLHSFDVADGFGPNGLLQATDGNFYGTTFSGGAGYCVECGTVFKITTPEDTLSTLYTFCSQPNCRDGSSPNPIVQATDGNFYGTTEFGGSNDTCGLLSSNSCGTVFKITAGGILTTLNSFDGSDGFDPFAALVQAADGNFYGTAFVGGTDLSCGFSDFDSCGTVFRMTAQGTLTLLHSFEGSPTEGANSYARLVQGTDGSFYGTTGGGGANRDPLCNSPENLIGCGTVFKITPTGTLTTLYSFCSQPNCADGYFPVDGLVQGTDGNFYGTTAYGGDNDNCAYYDVTGCGTVFRITPSGTLTTLRSFCSQPNCTDGSFPGALIQATDGNFHGTTAVDGADYYGTIFSLSVGLGPFVETEPSLGGTGTPVVILGTNLTGATSVTFNGTPATFTVVSASEITTTVPAGATTGKVQVTTPNGLLSSNTVFRVTPSISGFSPRIGRVGTTVVISGGTLRGATSVTFGGVQARSFIVDSPMQIRARVPAGARTGKIGVTTPAGSATSTGTFTVL